MGTTATKGVCLPCQPKSLCRPNSVVSSPPVLQSSAGAAQRWLLLLLVLLPIASIHESGKKRNGLMAERLKPMWENKLRVSFKKQKKKKKKILLPFESLWGHWEHASKLFCSALRDGKLLLIQENKALRCHYQQQQQAEMLMNTLLQALWQ